MDDGDVQPQTVEENIPGPQQSRRVGKPPLLPVGDGEAQDPLAQGGSENAQQQRLQEEHHQHRYDPSQHLRTAAPLADVHPEDRRQQNVPEETVDREIHPPRQEAADGGRHLGLRVLPGEVRRPAGTAGELVEIALGIQVLVADLGLPQLPADGLRLAEGRPLLGNAREPPGHQLLQGEGAILGRLDVRQGHPQQPQQLDALQGLQVLLGVVPVAVLPPLRGEKALRLIVADVGPAHAAQRLDLFDGHAVCPPFLGFCRHSTG